MRENSGALDHLLSGVIRLILPILLILSSVWIILQMANLWIPLEYRMPGFPDDPYGFTLEDRLYWSRVDVAYLQNDEGIEYFDDYYLDNGDPMHNARELQHMEDVKDLIKVTWRVLGLGWVIFILAGALVGTRLGWELVVEMVTASARGTIWLMFLLALGLVIAFGVLFVGFHRLFFEGDTWLFSYSDTFIRLYPERFWRDTFALVAIVTLVLSLILRWLPKRIDKFRG
jgi:integral membrane protein (TIGR01906 family)